MALTRLVNNTKDSVVAATTGANINLAAAPNTLDGVTLSVNNRILVKDQNPASLNGIYRITTLGTGSNGSWTRASDFNDWREATAGVTVFVELGAINGNSFYFINGGEPNVQINTTAINFSNLYSVNSNVTSLPGNLSVAGYATVANVVTLNGIFYPNGSPAGGLPGGANTNLQFSNAGVFGGTNFLQYNYISGNLVSNSTTTSTSSTTGALVVGGGVGIGGNLVANGYASFGYSQGGALFRPIVGGTQLALYNLSVTPSQTNYSWLMDGYATTINSVGGIYLAYQNAITATINGTQLSVGTTTQSTSTTTGALVVSGGAGIAGNLYVGGNLSVAGNTVFVNTSTITTTDTIAAPVINAGTIGNSGATFTGASDTITGNSSVGNLNSSGQVIGYLNGVVGANVANSAFFTTANVNGTLYVSTLQGGTIGNTGATFTGLTQTLTGNSTVGNLNSANQVIGYLNGVVGANVANSATFTNVNITGTSNSYGVGQGALQIAGGFYAGGDSYIAGNLVVANINSIGYSQLIANAPLLYLAANSVTNYNYEIGFYSHKYDSVEGYNHTGIVRNHSDNSWYVFSNIRTEPGTTVDLGNASIIYDTVKLGNLVAIGGNITGYLNGVIGANAANSATFTSISANTFTFTTGYNPAYRYTLLDISDQFDGQNKKFSLVANDLSTLIVPNNPNQIDLRIGSLPIAPTLYVRDYQNLPEPSVFKSGFYISNVYTGISYVSRSNNIATIITSAPHLLRVGNYVTITNVTISGNSAPQFNSNVALVTSVSGTNTFSYVNPYANVTNTAALSGNINSVTLNFATAPIYAMPFFGTAMPYDTVQSFSYKQTPFSALNIMLGS